MLNLIWSILNTGLILYFFYLLIEFLVRRKRFLKSKHKVIYIVILFLGSFSIISYDESAEKTKMIKFHKEYDETKNRTSEIHVIEDNLTLDIKMVIEYSVDSSRFIPIEATSTITGFTAGFDWDFEKAYTKDGSKYIVEGTLLWNIFRLPIYKQRKVIEGVFK